MAKIAGGRLAAAVSEAGGLGLIGGGYGDLDWIEGEWQAAAGSRVGIGLITWHVDRPTLDAVLELQPAAVWLSFGEESFGIDAVHAAGAVAIVQVASGTEASAALDVGVDVLVAQGTESGGHGRPQLKTFDLVEQLAALARSTPIVAAGGITTSSDFDRAVAAGASGVALGTAFYATLEAADVREAKQRLVEASSEDTVRSSVYDRLRGPDWPARYNGRSLRTELTETWSGRESAMDLEIDALRRAYTRAAAAEDMTKRVVWAGEGVGSIDAIVPAREVVERFPAFSDS